MAPDCAAAAAGGCSGGSGDSGGSMCADSRYAPISLPSPSCCLRCRPSRVTVPGLLCCAAGLALVAVGLSGAGGGGSRVALEARSSPGVGWAGDETGWARVDGGSPEMEVRGDGKKRGERRGLDGEWMGLPSNKAYYADGWNAGTPDKYWYSTCSRANGCSGENRPQNVAERTDAYDDGWDRRAEPVPKNIDWMRYGHAPYTGSVLNKHGEQWESYPYGDVNAYLDSYTGPFGEADLDHEIRNGAGRNGGWANREQERDGGWFDGKAEKKELDAQGKGADRYSYFWRTDNVMGYPEKDLPIRSTYEYDVTTGGKPYERFWGGEDAIAKDVRGVSDFFKNDNDTPEAGSNEKFAMSKWFADAVRSRRMRGRGVQGGLGVGERVCAGGRECVLALMCSPCLHPRVARTHSVENTFYREHIL